MRIIRFFLIIALGASCVHAENSPATIDFLKKLSLHYYCLNREGLQNFKCEMRMTLPEGYVQRFKDELRRNNIFQGDQCVDALNGIVYVLTVEEGNAHLAMTEPASTDDPKADEVVSKQAAQYEHLIEQVVQMWTQLTMTPFYSDSDLIKRKFQVVRTAGGFNVVESDAKGDTFSSSFDSQANLLDTEGSAHGISVGMKTHYTSTPKGFVLWSWDMNIGQITYHGSIDYGVVEKYWLPKKWTFDFMVPGALAEEDEFTLGFSNFSLNSAAKTSRPLIQVVGEALPPTYHHNFSTAQIERHNKTWIPSRNTHEPGLTQFHYDWGYRYQFATKTDPDQQSIQFSLTSLDVLFSISKFEVYVSSRYPEGSCPYRVILDHENTHVAIDMSTYKKYKAIMLQTLENDTLLPTKEHPWKASTIKKAKYMLKAHLDETVNKVVKAFWAEAGLANAKIDLPSSYAEAQAKCTNW